MHYLIKQAYQGLYPEKEPEFEAKLKYSRAFKGYNAKVKYTKNSMEFRLAHSWKEVSDEIKIGLLQHLFTRVYRNDAMTLNMDLYNIFLKKIPNLTPKTKTDPMLEEAFNRVNDEYFGGLQNLPNLEFGGRNFNTLGTYEYTTDTIRISDVLRKDLHILDYVMYHEMLHKKLKYRSAGTRTIHHSREFREKEKEFSDPEIEIKLKDFLRKERLRERFWFL